MTGYPAWSRAPGGRFPGPGRCPRRLRRRFDGLQESTAYADVLRWWLCISPPRPHRPPATGAGAGLRVPEWAPHVLLARAAEAVRRTVPRETGRPVRTGPCGPARPRRQPPRSGRYTQRRCRPRRSRPRRPRSRPGPPPTAPGSRHPPCPWKSPGSARPVRRRRRPPSATWKPCPRRWIRPSGAWALRFGTRRLLPEGFGRRMTAMVG